MSDICKKDPKKYFAERTKLVQLPHMETPCHKWTGTRSGNYGAMRFENKNRMQVHRVAFELFVRPLEPNETVDHTCENRLCCNPEHLHGCTMEENQFARGRNKQIEKPLPHHTDEWYISKIKERSIVDPVTGCWNSTFVLDKAGRANMGFRGKSRMLVHRVAYICTKGPIPEGMTVNHDCENPKCCNPEHLTIMTQSENTQSSVVKGMRSNKLDIPKVKKIKILLADGTLSQCQIADIYGVTQVTINQIKTGKSWRHV